MHVQAEAFIPIRPLRRDYRQFFGLRLKKASLSFGYQRKEMTLDMITCRRICSLILTWQPALADGQVTVHQVVAISLDVRVRETELVAHLVFDRGQQIDVTCRQRVWTGVTPRG